MGPVTIRSTGNVVVAIAVWVFCLVALVDGVLRGTGTYIFHDVLVAAAAALGAWIIFFRPRVIVRDQGLQVINLLRSFDIGWDSLVDWRVGGVLQLQFRTADQRIRKAASWGAPGVRKSRPGMSAVLGRDRGLDPNAGEGIATADLRSVTELAIEHRERDWRRTHPISQQGSAQSVAQVTWNWLPAAVLVALIIIRVAVG
jgi:hypothetical protein